MAKFHRTEIALVSSVERFRALARQLPAKEDAVLEIGCSTAQTTLVLARRCARVVAVDLGEEMVERARQATTPWEHVCVARMDGRDVEGLRTLLPRPDLIFLDVGGNALLGNVASVLRGCLRVFAPRKIVVRSLELATLHSLIAEVELPGEAGLQGPDPRGRLLGAAEHLLELSHSSNAGDRVFAARKLRALGTEEALRRLGEMEDDTSSTVRRIARWARPGAAAPSPRQ